MNELSDRDWMLRALELAWLGRGRVEPNPMVGAVVVREGRLVGEGFHSAFGGPHAEVHALDAAGALAEGATLYVTLEPCCHHGKTPPCTDRILSAGIKRVVAAMLDPFPQVAGKGVDLLRARGLTVQAGHCEAEARQLNAAYLKLLRTGRPFVHVKWAMSADGKIATRSGASKWITGAEARAHAHRFRGLVDGILVGAGTVRADDPLLSARPAGPRVACRVVLDSRAEVPLDSQLIATAREIPTLIACTERAPSGSLARLESAGCECLILPASDDGRVPIGDLLDRLGERRWTHLLVEGGSEVLGSFHDANAIDAIRTYLAPCLIGGGSAPGPLGGIGRDQMADVSRYQLSDWEKVGDDLFLEARRIEDAG